MPAKSLKDIACAQCGTTFRPINSRIKFCSYECSNKSKRKLTPEPQATRSDEREGDSRTVTITSDRPPKNDRELIEWTGVDQKEWVVSSWKSKTWEGYAKDNDGRIVTKMLWATTATFVRNHEYQANKALIDELFASARKRSPKVKRSKPPATGVALEFGPYDAHFGLLAQGRETRGANYDLDIAEADWSKASDSILSRAAFWKFERIYFVVGNDLSHIDNRQNMTFAGTPQDVDSRYHKIVRRIIHMLCDQIERMARDVAPVHVPIVPGNHDESTAMHIGNALEAYFHKNPNVTIDNGPSSRKYAQWGINLIGWTHGNLKAASIRGLPNIMANEQREAWAETIHRVWHCGHLHTRMTDEHFGVLVERFMALCPASAWASREGYVGSKRGAEAHVWHKQLGPMDSLKYLFPE